MGGIYFDHPVKNGPFLHCNFPTLQLAMPSFDSRTIDDVVLPKALNYIKGKAENKVRTPFLGGHFFCQGWNVFSYNF